MGSGGETLLGVQLEALSRGFRKRNSAEGSGRDILQGVLYETLCRGFRRRHSVGGSGRDTLQGILYSVGETLQGIQEETL